MAEIIKGDRVPLYYQLMDIILEEIKSGRYKENDKLPSERELCEMYDISRATVRQTIQELEKEGYIYKQHGKGTFVSPERLKQDLLKFYSFTEEMKKLGKTPSSKVINFEIIEVDEKISKKMNMPLGERLYKFTRLRLADTRPMMVETSYIPYNRFKDISKNNLEQESIYNIFTKKYNAVFSMAEESFQPVSTKADEAKLLESEPGSPGMMIERITYEENSIIEYTIGIARGDRFKFRVILKK